MISFESKEEWEIFLKPHKSTRFWPSPNDICAKICERIISKLTMGLLCASCVIRPDILSQLQEIGYEQAKQWSLQLRMKGVQSVILRLGWWYGMDRICTQCKVCRQRLYTWLLSWFASMRRSWRPDGQFENSLASFEHKSYWPLLTQRRIPRQIQHSWRHLQCMALTH